MQLCSSVIAHLPACKGKAQEGCALQAMVELYEFLLKCSCDLAQEAPPPRKFRMSGGHTKAPDTCNNDIKQSCRVCLGLCSACMYAQPQPSYVSVHCYAPGTHT